MSTPAPSSLKNRSALPALEDLQALRESVAEVLRDHCDSLSLHGFIDGKSPLDRTLWARAAELGWLASSFPETYGGLDLGPQGLDILHRELGLRAAPGPYIATLAAGHWLLGAGDEDQKAAHVPLIAAGELMVAIPALTYSEPSLTFRDQRVYGQFEVLGSEMSGLAVAPVKGADGASQWALIACDGVSASLTPNPMWDRTREVCVLRCEAAVPTSLIPDPQGHVTDSLALQLALAVASDSVGAAGGIFNKTLDYMKTRTQFDRPIAAFQALKHRAANLCVRIATDENLLTHAVEAAAQGDQDANMWAALAKAGASEGFAFVAADSVQLHGAVGHTWEFDCHIYMKRARLNEALGRNNRDERDFAAAALTNAARIGRSTAEFLL